MDTKEINKEICKLDNAQNISDGYHTFKELYEHRHLLYLALCANYKDYCYWTYKNSDGSSYNNYFLLVLKHPEIDQISYHLPIELLDYIEFDIKYKDICDDYDGHNSEDVIDRLLSLTILNIK